MKSEHRHELKTNELAEWIANFPQWAQENMNSIIYVAVCIIFVAGIYFYYGWYNTRMLDEEQRNFTGLLNMVMQGKVGIIQSQSQGYDSSSLLFSPARDLRTVSQKTKNSQMGALALIKSGDALRMELHYRLVIASPQEADGQINNAKSAYTDAIAKAAGNNVLTAQAKLGLGLCEEELGNFEQAKQIYSEIASNPDYKYTIAAAQAKDRLGTMDDYKQKVVFKAPPPPAPAETVSAQPMVKPGIVGIGPVVQSPNSTGVAAPKQTSVSTVEP